MNKIRIIVNPIEELPGDRGFHCTGVAGRFRFTAGMHPEGWNQIGWNVGLLNRAVVVDDRFNKEVLEERTETVKQIKNYLNKHHWKGGITAMGGKTVTHKQLQEAALDINKVFALDPAIDSSNEVEELTKEIKTNTLINPKYPESGMRDSDIKDGEGPVLADSTLKSLLAIGGIPEELILMAEEKLGDSKKEKQEPEDDPENETEPEPKKEEKKVAKKKITKKKTTAKKAPTKKKPVAKKVVSEKVPAKKTVSEKAPVTKKKKKVNQGIGAFVMEGLKDNKFKKKSNEEIAELVQKKFNSNTTAQCIAYYKNKIK